MLDELLRFVDEDLRTGDITTLSCIPEGTMAKGFIKAKEDGILGGLAEAVALFTHFGIECTSSVKDGDSISRGDTIISFTGDAQKILGLERVALNIMMRLSGIASYTWELAEKCRPHGVKVAGTRKITPGFRYFEKKAIEIGGGEPHRYALDDMILIKENHIAVAGLVEAITRCKGDFTKKIEVEVSTLEDAVKACEAGVDIVMLDNLLPGEITDIIAVLEKKGLREGILIELSGGINDGNIADYAALGADIISMGALTTASRWLDMSLVLE